MFRLPEFRRLFRLIGLKQSNSTADVDAEFEFHLEERVAELRARGLSESEARGRAIARFGDLPEARRFLAKADRVRQRHRRLGRLLDDVRRDVTFSLRGVRREPGFALIALLVLGLGVGLTTAMVTITDRMILHPLDYPGADRMGVAWVSSQSGEHGMRILPTQVLWEAWRTRPQFERVEAFRGGPHLLEPPGQSLTLVQGREVTPGLLPALGARVALGRGLGAEDTLASAPLVAVLAWGAWQSRFGADPAVLGQPVRVDGQVVTIVGVLRPGVDLSSLDREARTELWLPLRPTGQNRSASVLIVRRPGVTLEEATAEVGRVFHQLPESDRPWTDFEPIIDDANRIVAKDLTRTVALLTGATGLVLLVATANIAALLLGRALKRFQEFGVRAALGAGRGRVARQLATESVLLGLVGGAIGLGLAQLALEGARLFRPDTLRGIDEISVSWIGLGYAMAVSLAAALAFGLAPIWAVSRSEGAVALVGRTRRAHDGRGPERLRSFLVIAQLAISVTLMVGAGLLIQSFVKSQRLPFGFEPRQLGNVRFDFPERQFPTPARRIALRQVMLERARQVPGVRDIVMAQNSALDMGVMRSEFLPEGSELPAVETLVFMPSRWVPPEFFRVAGIPLVAGRPMSADTASRELVIDEQAARRYWPDGAVGRRVRLSRTGPWHTVVGVATDQRMVADAFGDAPTLYSHPDQDDRGGVLMVRFDHPAVLNDIAAAVRAVDPDIRVWDISTVEAALASEFAGRRFSMALITSFAAVTLLLAAIGLYGTIALNVAQRRFEIGVRLAVGATPETVRWMVLREGIGRVVAGLAVGAIGVVAMGKVIAAMLYRSTPWNSAVFITAAVALALVGVVAAWLPARRASRVDPLLALRSD